MTISNRITFEQLIGCKYPIAIMAMNRVSDVKLAVAGANAGVLPSLSVFNYYTAPNVCSLTKLNAALNEFNTITNNAPLLLSVSVDSIIDNELFNCILSNNIKVIELIFDDPNEIKSTAERKAKVWNRLGELKQAGSLIFTKSLGLNDFDHAAGGNIDGIILKGPLAAGRVTDGLDLLESIAVIKSTHPDLHVIASGGIGNAAQIQECINAGAIGVGLGTIFAAASESSISTESKLKMVAATAVDIAKLKGGAKQNALIFDELPVDNYNNTHGLIAGTKNPNHGHIFAGSSIRYITEIATVEEIVKKLTTDLY